MHFTGTKYDAALSIQEIAQLVRQELRDRYPRITATVLAKQYTGGCSLTITIRKAPFPLMEGWKAHSSGQHAN